VGEGVRVGTGERVGVRPTVGRGVSDGRGAEAVTETMGAGVRVRLELGEVRQAVSGKPLRSNAHRHRRFMARLHGRESV
jgi:hypothetical protein